MPVWHEATSSLRTNGKVHAVGVIQEQHPDCCRLFMQWKQMDWPVLVDSMNLLQVSVVPIALLLDERGIVREIMRDPRDLAERLDASEGAILPCIERTGLALPLTPRKATQKTGHSPAHRNRPPSRAASGVGWRLSVSAFGDLKTASAVEAGAMIDAEQKLDQVRANVVNVHQDVIANRQLGDLAYQQVESAEEALRLTQANLQAGTMTTLDVLQAQDAVTQARLRYIQAVVGYNQAQITCSSRLA